MSDADIISARARLWSDYRITAEYGCVTAQAALLATAHVPQPGERIAVVACGADTDPATLSTRPTASRPSEAAETHCDAAHIDAK